MNVLYISYDGMTDPLGQSQVIPYLRGLSQLGYRISLISCEKKERFKKNELTIQRLLESAGIKWFPVPYSTLPSVLSKQLNLRAIQKKANEICRREKPALVHCRSYMAALIGLKLKYKFGIRFIFDMRGFWADERIDGGIWNPANQIHKRIYAFFKKKEIEFLLNSDYTISLTENAKTEMESWKALQGRKLSIEVIPCCADLELFSSSRVDQAEKDLLKKKLGIGSGDLVISYLGSIGTWYMLDEMLDFFKQLSSSRPDAKFLFITPDDEQMILRKVAEKKIPKEQVIIRPADRRSVPLFLSLSDLSLYFIRPFYSKKASSPTKTGEIMAMGIPLITNTGIGDSDLMLSACNAGMLISDFNSAEYKRIIEQIDVLLALDKKKIQEAAKNYFSLEEGVKKYAAVYKKVIQSITPGVKTEVN